MIYGPWNCPLTTASNPSFSFPKTQHIFNWFQQEGWIFGKTLKLPLNLQPKRAGPLGCIHRSLGWDSPFFSGINQISNRLCVCVDINKRFIRQPDPFMQLWFQQQEVVLHAILYCLGKGDWIIQGLAIGHPSWWWWSLGIYYSTLSIISITIELKSANSPQSKRWSWVGKRTIHSIIPWMAGVPPNQVMQKPKHWHHIHEHKVMVKGILNKE